MFADVGAELDKSVKDAESLIEEKWKHLGETKPLGTAEQVEELLTSERFKAAGGR